MKLLGLAPSGLQACLGWIQRLRLLGGYPRSLFTIRFTFMGGNHVPDL